jgi:hypothetical protein
MTDTHCRVWIKAVARLTCVNSGEIRWASDPYPVRLRWADDGNALVTDRELVLKVTLGGWSGKIGLYIKDKLYVSFSLDDYLSPMNTIPIPIGELLRAAS